MHGHEQDGDFELIIATANVRTLNPKQELRAYNRVAGAMLLGRIALVEETLHCAGVQICGIQEGRCPTEQERVGSRFLMLIACASSSGNHGVQCWIHHDLGAKVRTVMIKSPRLMGAVVFLQQLGSEVAILVGHAPMSAHVREERLEFFLES